MSRPRPTVANVACAGARTASNADPRFARGRVRHGLLGALRGVHPAAEANVLRTIEILRAEAAVLEEVVDVALAGRARISLERLAALPPALARLVVIRLAEDAAGAPVATVGSRLGDLLELGHRGGSAALEVGGGVRAVVEYGVLRFERERRRRRRRRAVALAVPERVAFGEWELSAARSGRRRAATAPTPATAGDARRRPRSGRTR